MASLELSCIQVHVFGPINWVIIWFVFLFICFYMYLSTPSISVISLQDRPSLTTVEACFHPPPPRTRWQKRMTCRSTGPSSTLFLCLTLKFIDDLHQTVLYTCVHYLDGDEQWLVSRPISFRPFVSFFLAGIGGLKKAWTLCIPCVTSISTFLPL